MWNLRVSNQISCSRKDFFCAWFPYFVVYCGGELATTRMMMSILSMYSFLPVIGLWFCISFCLHDLMSVSVIMPLESGLLNIVWSVTPAIVSNCSAVVFAYVLREGSFLSQVCQFQFEVLLQHLFWWCQICFGYWYIEVCVCYLPVSCCISVSLLRIYLYLVSLSRVSKWSSSELILKDRTLKFYLSPGASPSMNLLAANIAALILIFSCLWVRGFFLMICDAVFAVFLASMIFFMWWMGYCIIFSIL